MFKNKADRRCAILDTVQLIVTKGVIPPNMDKMVEVAYELGIGTIVEYMIKNGGCETKM